MLHEKSIPLQRLLLGSAVRHTANRASVETLHKMLAGERYFREDPPTPPEGRHNQANMSRQQARHRQRRLVKMLAYHAEDALAKVLGDCEPGRRCGSGACLECGCATQQVVVEAAVRLVEQSEERFGAIEIVVPNYTVEEGDAWCGGNLCKPASDLISSVLTDAQVSYAFGGFDISAHESSDGSFSPYYRPHALLFAPVSQLEVGIDFIQRYFRRTPSVHRPIQIQSYDFDPDRLAQALNMEFVGRVSSPPTHQYGGQRKTRKRPLIAVQKVALAVALNNAGLADRIFLHGLCLEEVDGAPLLRRLDD